jgi:uncharacterized protein (DUF1778 family)
MPQAVRKKDHPLSMRLPEEDVSLIDRAAAIRGRSRTEFVRDAAVRAAEEVVLEGGLIRLSGKGFEEFMKILAAPAKPVPALVEIMKRPPPWKERV